MFDKLTSAEIEELTPGERRKIEYIKSAFDNRVVVPILAVRWFCDVAFSLALRSYQARENILVAKTLDGIFDDAINSGLVSLDTREKLRSSIANARLDFSYAAGNHSVASMRLAPYIMQKSKRL